MAISTKMARAKAEAVYWDNYVKWLADASTRGEGVGNGKPRPPSQVLHIAPFALDLSTEQDLLKVSANASSWNSHKAKWTVAGNKYARDDWGDAVNENSLDFKYRPAKVGITTGKLTTGIKKIAKGTKKPYLSYNGAATVSTSIPFGRGLGALNAPTASTELEVFTLIYNQFLVQSALPAGTAVTHIKEKGS